MIIKLAEAWNGRDFAVAKDKTKRREFYLLYQNKTWYDMFDYGTKTHVFVAIWQDVFGGSWGQLARCEGKEKTMSPLGDLKSIQEEVEFFIAEKAGSLWTSYENNAVNCIKYVVDDRNYYNAMMK